MTILGEVRFLMSEVPLVGFHGPGSKMRLLDNTVQGPSWYPKPYTLNPKP